MYAMPTMRPALILSGLLAFPAHGGEPGLTWDERSRALADQLRGAVTVRWPAIH